MNQPEPTTGRRTKRRYAHEIYPHPAEEWENRSLHIDVPYLYARFIGFNVTGTGWHDVEDREVFHDRLHIWQHSAQLALLADALQQKLTGDEAWKWVNDRMDYEGFEITHDRATDHGVPTSQIKPYPCGPEPAIHWHWSSTGDITGDGISTAIHCPESECEICTEPIPAEIPGQTSLEELEEMREGGA